MTAVAIPPEKKRELVETLRDPVRFAATVLQHKVWETPAKIMHAIDKPRARVAVKACHASSKTFTAAEIVLFMLARYKRVKVVTTAPTWHQVKTLLWGEIHKAVGAARIGFPTPNDTELEIKKGVRFAEGLSTKEAVRFQGYHADEDGVVLIILDEAPGVIPGIYEAIEGIRAGGDVRVLALGNPTIASGPFYAAFTSQRATWTTFTIDAFDTPNLAGVTIEDLLRWEQLEKAGSEEERIESATQLDHAPRPYLITRRFVLEKYHEWGPTNPLYQSRVRGQFPSQAEDALLSLDWIEQAGYREPIDSKGDLVGGIDVAGPGEDETGLMLRSSDSIVHAQFWPDSDPRGDLAAVLAPHKKRIRVLNVDSAGIGYYLALYLADLGYPVRLVNVGVASIAVDEAGDPKFANLKAELYWQLRSILSEGGLRGGEWLDETTKAQLAGIRYRHDARGRVVIESKVEARKRGVRSPDRAETLMLTFTTPLEAREETQQAMPDRARVRIGADI